MPTHSQFAQPAADAATEPRLIDCLNGKLAELMSQGFDVLWIECSKDDLTRLVLEDTDEAIRLDPDPVLDRAWYGGIEIRHSATRELTWVFLKGESEGGEVSAHIVSLPDQPAESQAR
jgi:hypothetical protein